MTTEKPFLDIFAILKYLPHRYPFLLVDRVLECVPGESIRAVKNVTFNEPHFTGHFPDRPVMPGVMILEALAQCAGILCFVTADIYPDENVRFVTVSHPEQLTAADWSKRPTTSRPRLAKLCNTARARLF